MVVVVVALVVLMVVLHFLLSSAWLLLAHPLVLVSGCLLQAVFPCTNIHGSLFTPGSIGAIPPCDAQDLDLGILSCML